MGRLAESLFETLRLAGFRLDDERDLQLGQIAYSAAALIDITREDARRERQRRLRKTGRNDPCPCGSGLKYKKCCLGRRKAARAESTARVGGQLLDPALIPNPTDEDAALRDLGVLEALFERDPGLGEVRYSAIAAMRFLEQELGDRTVSDEEAVDDAAHRYAAEVEPEVTGQLRDRLLEAASRTSEPGELRALALGLVLAMSYEADGHGPNPLLCMLFKLSIRKPVGALARVDRLIEKHGDREAMLERLVGGDPGFDRELTDIAASLDPQELDALRESFDAQLDEAVEIIGQDRFPVGLPLASLLPLYARLDRLAQSGKPPDDEVGNALAAALEDLLPEDLAVFGELLDRWLASDDGEDRAVTNAVRTVRGLAVGRSLDALWWPLAAWSIRTATYSPLEGEEDLLSDDDGSLLSARFLERYARFLEDRGHPALARRTRSLAGEQLELAGGDRSTRKRRRRQKRAR